MFVIAAMIFILDSRSHVSLTVIFLSQLSWWDLFSRRWDKDFGNEHRKQCAGVGSEDFGGHII